MLSAENLRGIELTTPERAPRPPDITSFQKIGTYNTQTRRARYDKVPNGVKLDLKKFQAHVAEQKLQDFKTLLRLSPIAPENYENSDPSVERRYGMPRRYLVHAKDHWLNQFDWREREKRINSFPNFTTTVEDDLGNKLTVHFVALFSTKPDAIPIALFHGWPGSFLEFLHILDLLKQKYSPEDLPYHVIVPSIPGYAYSFGPPVDSDYSLENATVALHNLMIGLGFDTGYLAQGGDLGSHISRHLAANFSACKGMHLNFAPMSRPRNADQLPLDDIEREALGRGLWYRDVETAYALEHGTRTATIGFCLSASPLALLSWIGEKFLIWTDEDPPLDEILESVTLYWMTDTFARCIYPYRGLFGDEDRPRIAKISGRGRPRPYVDKPCGYSFFPYELLPMPRSWIATSCNLVHSALHRSGGHFAAMEKPNELLEDIEEYIRKAWKFPRGKL